MQLYKSGLCRSSTVGDGDPVASRYEKAVICIIEQSAPRRVDDTNMRFQTMSARRKLQVQVSTLEESHRIISYNDVCQFLV